MSQATRNGVIVLATLIALAGGIGWGFDAALDDIQLDLDSGTSTPSETRRCTIEHRTLVTALAAAAATPEPDQWSDYLEDPSDLRYWTVVDGTVVAFATLPDGCP